MIHIQFAINFSNQCNLHNNFRKIETYRNLTSLNITSRNNRNLSLRVNDLITSLRTQNHKKEKNTKLNTSVVYSRHFVKHLVDILQPFQQIAYEQDSKIGVYDIFWNYVT